MGHDGYSLLSAALRDNEDLDNYFANEGIKWPLEAVKMKAPGGFFDSLTNEQAQHIYTILST